MVVDTNRQYSFKNIIFDYISSYLGRLVSGIDLFVIFHLNRRPVSNARTGISTVQISCHYIERHRHIKRSLGYIVLTIFARAPYFYTAQ